MDKLIAQLLPLSDDAQEVLACVDDNYDTAVNDPGVHQWLLALLECRGYLSDCLTPEKLDLPCLQHDLRRHITQGDIGKRLSKQYLLARADECARNRGEEQLSARDLACIILTESGYALTPQDAETLSDSDCDTIYLSLSADDEVAHAVESATPLLDQLGNDLTRAARAQAFSPVIGRRQEIQQIIETLCRRTKRNPVLIGPAGVGKTAIVEGLAQQIAAGQVPAALSQLRIVQVSVTSLVANCKFVGEFEERMNVLLKEASNPEIVLFIDEAHTMMGAGAAGRNDMANIVKPALSRGDVACIAATTDEEYRLYIESDSALERRFQPVRVQELTPEQTLDVLMVLRDQLARQRGVEVPSPVLEWIVSFAGQYLRNRYFPDKAVDLLEQCVACGLTQGKTVLTQADVEVVAQRMVGMPLAVQDRLAQLHERLSHHSLLPAQTTSALAHRLGVTLRGLDINAARPNAVLMLLDDAASQGEMLCETMAECLFGVKDRIVTIDFSRFLTHADITMLVGAPPGYIGFEGHLSLHQVLQMPWCVLYCENIQAAHPSAREILTQGLRSGVISLADGKRVFLSDAIVVMTAETLAGKRSPLGFGSEVGPGSEALRERAVDLLGSELINQVDITCHDLCEDGGIQQQWLERSLLTTLCERFRPQRVRLSFDPSLLPWLIARGSAHFTRTDWERLIDEHLCPAIIPHLPAVQPQQDMLLRLTVTGDACTAERC